MSSDKGNSQDEKMMRKYVRRTRRHAVGDPVSMHRPQPTVSPWTALKRRFNQEGYVVSPNKTLCRQPIFTLQQELEIVHHLKTLHCQMYGVNKNDVRFIAFHLAEHYSLVHNFDRNRGVAGKDWLDGFLKRHNEIIPLLTSRFSEHDKVNNKSMVSKFFRILREVMMENMYPAYRIFNASEISFTGSSLKCSKNRAGRLVEPLVTGPNFESVSSIVCMSAGGHFIPPMLIFHRKAIKTEMLVGAPKGTVFACNRQGWVVTNVFHAWFDHFLKTARPTSEDPALLILEGYLMHTKSFEMAMKAKESFVTIIFLPSLLFSRKLNPMESGVANTLMECYERDLENMMASKTEMESKSPVKNVRREKVTPIFAKAYAHAATANNAVNGFWKCGIYPYDPDIFGEEDFKIEQTA